MDTGVGFQQSMWYAKLAVSCWLYGPGSMLVWFMHVSFSVPLWFPDSPFLSIIMADAAGYVKAKAGWATVLWGIIKGGICWEVLLQACVSVYVMGVCIYAPGPVPRTKGQ